jgi:hypothetical protein
VKELYFLFPVEAALLFFKIVPLMLPFFQKLSAEKERLSCSIPHFLDIFALSPAAWSGAFLSPRA